MSKNTIFCAYGKDKVVNKKKLRCKGVRRKNCGSNVFDSVREDDVWGTSHMN